MTTRPTSSGILQTMRAWGGLVSLVVIACGGSTDPTANDGGAEGARDGGTSLDGGYTDSTDARPPTGSDGDAGDGGTTSGTGGRGGARSGGDAATTGDGGRTNADGGFGGGPPDSCTSDRECTPFGLLCDAALARCVQCVRDVDCNDDLSCRGGVCERIYACDNSLDCVDVPDERGICDPTTGECVPCIRDADCKEHHECLARTCVAYTPCVNSLDCQTDDVCDKDRSRCVQCVADPDCGEGLVCRNNACTESTCIPTGCDGRCDLVDDGCGTMIACGPCGSHCTDGIQNGEETDVDCGGPVCPACPQPSTGGWTECLSDNDCTEGRICTKPYLDVLGLGDRYGQCTHLCTSPAACVDPAPAGAGSPLCASMIYCVLPCSPAETCPQGMDCLPEIVAGTGPICRARVIP